MEPWRLITTWGADPSFNMGLDEALLLRAGTPPTLRLYSWSPDTLSLGYFQRYGDVPGVREAGAVVRRITGGGAIHHTSELTFSISVARNHPVYAGPIGRSYERVHGAIAEALRQVGVESAMRGDELLDSDREGTGMCFHKSTPLDLAWGGRKGVGSAQRRTATRILHHGSIKLGASALEEGIATASTPEAPLLCESFAPLLEAAFAAAFEASFERTVPDRNEIVGARTLGTRYLDPAFLKRR